MSHRLLPPCRVNIGLDANALDLDGGSRDALVARFRGLVEAGTINIVVAEGVRQEVQHAHTPSHVQDDVLPRIFNLRPGLNASQRDSRQRVAAILQGNARPETHAADASHLSEAAEAGCGYFITHDKRILGRRSELAAVLPPSLNIVTLEEFLAIFDDYDAGRRL